MASSARPKGIRLRTSFVTENEFIAAFQSLCDESTLFVPTDKLYPADTNCYFSLELVDEAPMLRGLGVVIDSWSIAQNPFNRPGIHVRITQLTTLSEPIFERVLAARPSALHKKGPRTRNAPMTHQQWGSMVEPPTMESPAYDIDEKTAISSADAEETKPAKPITREMRSASVSVVPSSKPSSLPSIPSLKPGTLKPNSGPTRSKAPSVSAAPITELDEKTSETTRYGDHLRLPATAPAATGSAPVSAPVSAPASAPARAVASGSPPPPMNGTSTPDRGVGMAPHAPAQAPALPPPPAIASSPRASSPSSPRAASPYPPAAGLDDRELGRRPTTWWQVAWWKDHVRTWRYQLRTGAWRDAWWANRRVGGVFAGGILLGVLFTIVLRPSHPTKAPALAANVPAHREVASCPPAPAPPAVVADADGDAPKRPAASPHTKANVKVAAATSSAKQNHAVGTSPPTKAAPTAKTATSKVASVAPTATKAAPATTKAAPTTIAKSSPAAATKTTTKSIATSPTVKSPSTTKSVATAPATKSAPAATKTATTAPATKSVATTTKHVTTATTKSVATTTKTAPTATKPAATATTKSVATTKTAPAATKPATTNVAAAKSATPSTKRGKRGACSSLDCI